LKEPANVLRVALKLPGLSLSALIRAGDKANSARAWKRAEIAYANALKKDPKLTHIWVQYGHALKEQGRLRPAEDAYRRALALDGTVADTHLQLGHVLKLQKRLTDAVDAYRSACRLEPGLTAAFDELRRMAAYRAGQRSTVDAGLDASIRAGDEANLARDWKAAEIAYANALKKDPRLTHIWVQYGHALKEQGRLPPAEDAYRRALALDGSVADTHLQLGHVLKLQRRPAEAVDAYRSAFRLDPGLTAALDELRGMGGDPADPESAVDIDFVNRLYNLDLQNSRIKPSDDAISALIANKISSNPPYLNRQMLLAAHRVSLRLLDIFDEDFYFYFNSINDHNLRSPCFAKCLLHFCEVGIGRLMPFNPDYIFDYQFYHDNFLFGHSYNERDAYRHWLRDGLDQGWPPSEKMWMRETLGLGVVDPEIFYALFNRKLRNNLRSVRKKPDPDEFATMIAEGGPPDPPETAEAARLLTGIADLLATRGENEVASVIYDRILQRFPESVQPLQHYADMLFRNTRYPAARPLYDKVRYLKGANIWTYVNLAECLKLMGNYEDALSVLREGADRFPHDLGIRERHTQLADEFFTKEVDASYGEARLGWLAEAQYRVAAACRAVTSPPQPGPPIPRRIKSIAMVGNLDLPQCRFYRIDQKLEQLDIAGYSVKLYDFRHQLGDFIREIYQFEVVIFYRVPASPKVIKTMENANELGLLTFYEIDDLIFDGFEYPTSYESYGGQITRKEYIGLCLGVPLFAHAMSMCTYGIASTTPLAQEMSRHVTTGRVFTHRNAFGSTHEALSIVSPRPRGTDNVTIFYGSGTKAHKEDFEELVVPALVEMVRRYRSQISIVIVGYVTITEQLRSIRENITLFDAIWNVEEYWKLLSEADINIAVLKPSLMADCKSEIKWLEAAMFAVPSVASRTATYAEVIEHGVSGLLCETQEDWITAIDRLVCDAGFRQEMGLAAQRAVRSVYTLDKMASRLRAIFNSLHQEMAVGKPTVVVVNVFYPPQAFGGATRVVHDNVRHFTRNYADVFNVEVFTSIEAISGFYETRSYVEDRVRITGVITPHAPDIDKRASDQRMGEIFGEYLDTVTPALVHFHCIQRLTASVVEAARERGIPYLITVHDGWWISDEQFIVDETGRYNLYDYHDKDKAMRPGRENSYLRMTALQDVLFNAYRVLAVSEPFASVYRSCGVTNVITVVNGVSEIPHRKRLHSPDGRVRVAFVGGMAMHKGYRLVRSAFLSETFEHLTLTIVDHSQPQGYLRQEYWGTTPVDFVGLIPQSDIFDLYCHTDVVLAPSIWPESYGLVTREALAAGCWVVASDRGAIGECIVEDENGYIIDVSDISGLVDVLRRIDNGHLRYSTQPHKVAALRSAVEQGEELARLYGEILNSGKRSNEVSTLPGIEWAESPLSDQKWT
jgi:glycosyltransferase involved in cell wall biosynthesis/cytochrome c-type biogenesis protein CcmH/NrfG